MADLSNFMPDMQTIRQNQLNYDLVKQAQADQAQAKQGFEDAYKQHLNAFSKPQESQLGELGQKLIGASEGERALAPREQWQPPAGSSFSYLQGAEQANAMFQQRQLDYLNRSIMPALKMAHDTNNNEIRDQLLAKLPELEQNPDAQLAVSYLKSIKNADFSHPGETRGITVTKDNITTLGKGDPVQIAKLEPYIGKTIDYSDQNGVIFKIGPSTAAAKAPKTITVPIDEKGTMGTFEYKDGDWVELASGKKMGGAGGSGAGAFRPTADPNIFYNTKERTLYTPGPSGALVPVSEAGGLPSGGIRGGAVDYQQQKAEARARGGEQTARIVVAAQTLKDSRDEMVELANRIRAKQILPSSFPSLNKLNDWLANNAGDVDVARFATGLQLQADKLAAAVGAGRGGKWSFDMAKELLNKNYSPQAFAAVFDGHIADLEQMAKRRREYGTTPISKGKPSPNTARLSATIAYLKKKFPGRTEADYQKAAEASLK